MDDVSAAVPRVTYVQTRVGDNRDDTRCAHPFRVVVALGEVEYALVGFAQGCGEDGGNVGSGVACFQRLGESVPHHIDRCFGRMLAKVSPAHSVGDDHNRVGLELKLVDIDEGVMILVVRTPAMVRCSADSPLHLMNQYNGSPGKKARERTFSRSPSWILLTTLWQMAILAIAGINRIHVRKTGSFREPDLCFFFCSDAST